MSTRPRKKMTRMTPATKKHTDITMGSHTNIWRTQMRFHHRVDVTVSWSSSLRSSSCAHINICMTAHVQRLEPSPTLSLSAKVHEGLRR